MKPLWLIEASGKTLTYNKMLLLTVTAVETSGFFVRQELWKSRRRIDFRRHPQRVLEHFARPACEREQRPDEAEIYDLHH